MDTIKSEYLRWRQRADASLQRELAAMGEEEMTNAFFRDLEFGTGGLRGELGAGTNRMNLHTVSKASQGLANYLCEEFPPEQHRVAVSYDSRILSKEFAQTASAVFAANGITVFIYDRLMPTPCLSFAVRALNCCAGVMVTASHNPAQYNGYKVYNADGCQITTEAAAQILAEIEAVDVFDGIRSDDYDSAVASGQIQSVPESITDAFIAEVKAQSLLGEETVDRSAPIVYTPLNGSGREPVLRVLRECGYKNITLVPEQEMPDGNFPTCPYPNPEVREALSLAISCAEKTGAELVLATDPDCDRVGAAVRNGTEYTLISGNEMGLLLLDYICARRTALGTMPQDPVFVKTIVTTELAAGIAARHGVRTIDVLTGFKFIGEQIGLLEREGRENSYIFGFEESYGYLSGSYVRDKDAVNGALLICEMFAWHRAHQTSLLNRLEEIYAQVGYCLNTLHTYSFPGAEGFARMQELMAHFRKDPPAFGGKRVLEVLDYAPGRDGLPPSDVLEDRCSVVVRPSGTEPKLKCYLTVCAADRKAAELWEKRMEESVAQFFAPPITA